MNRFCAPSLSAVALLACAHLAQGLTVKPNVAPAVTSPVADYQQYFQTTRVINLRSAFKDPDASAAVKVTTVLGAMNFTLDGETAPRTVANFLNYVNTGRYFKIDPTNSQVASLFFHRAAPNFVIQSGGFIGTLDPDNDEGAIKPTPVATFSPIPNEPAISNTRGTIAMAKLANNQNSATSQWFINLKDNARNVVSGTDIGLDVQNGGFTVFGRVAGNGMTTVAAIGGVPIYNFGTSFDQLPLRDWNTGTPVKVRNLVSIPQIVPISPLQFSAAGNNTAVATVVVSGTNLLVTALQVGSAQIGVSTTDLDGATASDSFTVNVIAAPGRVRNISTRANFPNGPETLTGGFIVRGGTSKRLVVRAIGPSSGVPGALDDPTVELLNGTGQVIATNNNWMDAPNKQEIVDLGIAPGSPNESAILTTVPSQEANITTYTARMKSANGRPGVGLIEIYDVDSAPGSTLRNISTLGPVGTGVNVLVGGFIVRG
ncbi:MAG: peptidylprolyl isomerase, partial [Chthoniobacterales bacterium]|nr:peptidylprolyl isomerase [Chthoniobacterales bacterium]